MQSEKILLLGYDGLSPSKLQQLINEDKVPIFKRIASGGVSGTLKTTIPPISAPAWSSINTGLSPGRHGVFDFITRDHENPENDNKIHNSSSLRGKAVWDLLSKQGKKCILINVPLTYPPYPVNGVMISGFPSPRNVLVANPKNIERELQLDYPNYKIDVDIPSQDYDKVEKERILDEAYKIIETRTSLALDLMGRYEWDFFYVVYTMTDRIQHMFWAYDENPELNQSNEYGGEINRLYKTMDSVTGRYLEEIDDETEVIVISDHGFEYIHTQFNIVNWMRNENWIHKQPRDSRRFNLLKRLYKKIGSTGLVDTTNLYERLPRVFKQAIINEKINHVPGGLILDMYDLSREDIDRQKILDIRDPENNSRIIDNVYFKEEIYHGEYAENAVDILVQPKRGYIISTKSDGIINRIEYPFSNHISEDCRKGIFYAYGPMIPRNKIEINCIDVTPTILWTLIGNETKLEGVIRKEIFSEDN